MNRLLFLVYCMQILATLVCVAQNTTELVAVDQNKSDSSTTAKLFLTVPANTSISISGAITLKSTQSPKTIARTSRATSNSPITAPRPVPQPTEFFSLFNMKECFPVLMVTGGLIIACTMLLISCLLLAVKVCHLSRRIKALSSNEDLISNSEYWMRTANKNESKSDTEPKETSVLMADLDQTQEEMGRDATKEEEGNVNKDGQEEEENQKEVGDSANSQDASATPVAAVAENSSSSKPKEEATDSQPTKAAAASTSEGTKDVV